MVKLIGKEKDKYIFFDACNNMVFKTKINKDSQKQMLNLEQNHIPSGCNRDYDLFSLIRMQDIFLVSVTISVTSACNMSCKYCLVKNKPMTSFSPRNVSKLIEFLKINFSKNPHRKKHVHFYGGEPLLRFDLIKKIVSEISNLNVVFSITTNGTLLNRKIIDFLVKSGFFLTISMDGPSYIHDRWRPLKSFKPSHWIIEKNIKIIQSFYPDFMKRNVSIVAVLTPDYSLMERLEYFLTIGIRKAVLSKMDKESICFTGMKQKEYDEYFIKEYINLCEYIKKNLVTKNFEKIILFPCGKYFDLFRYHQKVDVKSLCGAGIKKIYITSNGDILPCVQFGNSTNLEQKYKIGNITEGINYKKVTNLYKKFTENNKNCRNCWVFYLCPGNCPYFRLNDESPDKDSCKFFDSLFKLYIKTYADIKTKSPNVLEEFAEYSNRHLTAKNFSREEI